MNTLQYSSSVAFPFNSHTKWCGAFMAIIAIHSSLAFMNGANNLISPALFPYRAIPNYIATVFLIGLIAVRSQKIHLFGSLFAVWSLFWILQNFHLASGITDSHIAWLELIIIFLFCLMDKTVYHYAYLLFRYYMITVSFFGIVAYISFLTGVIPPLKTVDYYGDWLTAYYIVYPFSNLCLDMSNMSLRLCGLFHEPADVGMFSMWILAAERLNLKNYGNICVFIAGILSFSFGFYVMFLVYLTIKIVMKSRKAIVPLICIVLVLLMAIPFIPKDSDLGIIIERFSYDKKEKSFSGNNRDNERFKTLYESASKNGDLLFGLGVGWGGEDNQITTSSYRATIMNHGYVGSIALYGLLLLAIVRYMPRRNLDINLLILCIIMSIYYSPHVLKPGKMIMLFGGMQHLYCLCYYKNNPLHIVRERLRSVRSLAMMNSETS